MWVRLPPMQGGASLFLGTSSVTAHYWLRDGGVAAPRAPRPCGTHAHELSMVLGCVLGEV